MRRLTINQIAAAGLRTGKRAYLSLAVGIFLSIFLTTVIWMAAQGVILASDRKNEWQIGYVDFVLLDEPDYTDEFLMESGMYSRLGHIYVTASVGDTQRYIGWYDEEGEALLNRKLTEGRMPERAGEIAVERSTLELLDPSAGVGSTLSLSLNPVNGVREERTFTLVGILTDQSDYFNPHSYSSSSMSKVRMMPTILIDESEPPLKTGRTVLHRAAKIAEHTSLYAVARSWEERDDSFNIEWFMVYGPGNVQSWAMNPLLLSDDETVIVLFVIAIFALALLTACGVGISQAMEGQLARRREEIGMLRAVGATRRQIRKIFGREAWLLALILSPLSVAAGCGAAYLLGKMAPELMVFSPNAALLIPVAVFSALCILISAWLPLRRASHIMPMSVLRDVELMRKTRSIRSQTEFRPAKLISSRQLRLYPSRQIGASILILLMLVCIFLPVGYLLPNMESVMPEDQPTFFIGAPYLPSFLSYDETLPRTRLGQQDIAQIASLPGIERIDMRISQEVNLLMDLSAYQTFHELPEYLQYMAEHTSGNSYLMMDEMEEWRRGMEGRNFRALQAAQGIEENVIQYSLLILTQQQVMELAGTAMQGRVDIDAINAGIQVIAYAPTIYVNQVKHDDNSIYTEYKQGEEPAQWTRKYENDLFRAGDTIHLMQLYHFIDEIQNDSGDENYEYNYYKTAHRVDAEPVIGAVIEGAVDLRYSEYMGEYLLTTYEGAQAMGFYMDAPSIDIYMDDDVDEETEEYLADRIRTISMRGEDAGFYNRIKAFRENLQQSRLIILTFGTVALIFLAVAVSIISGNVRRRILADTRMIGTLRAVGADSKVLVKCYMGQVLMSIVIGLAAAVALYAAFVAYMEVSAWWENLLPDIPLTLLVMAGFAGLCWLFCHLSLKMSIRSVVTRSIIENIREL